MKSRMSRSDGVGSGSEVAPDAGGEKKRARVRRGRWVRCQLSDRWDHDAGRNLCVNGQSLIGHHGLPAAPQLIEDCQHLRDGAVELGRDLTTNGN